MTIYFQSSTESVIILYLPPLNSFRASAKASMDSMSKLLVGSSCEVGWEEHKSRDFSYYIIVKSSVRFKLTMINISGCIKASSAKTTLAFWPPDRSRILIVWAWPGNP